MAIINIIKEIIPFLQKVFEKFSKKTKEDNHYLTSPPSNADTNDVIGRDKVLKSLWKTLKKNKHGKKKAVILTGFGGIGKTKLAQLLFHTYESKFDEVAWIDYQGDLKKSFLVSINVSQFHEKDYQNDDDRWDGIKRYLTNNRKKKLFIIDNVDHDANQEPEQDTDLRDLTGWENTTILLTSRRFDELNGYDLFKVDALDTENCIKLFKKYYKSEIRNFETVKRIIELTHGNTMTIVLLAKGARRENLDEFLKLIESGFEKVNREMVIDHHEGNVTIEHHLRLLFSMQNRSEQDRQILNSFAILPVNCECIIKEIEQWFGLNNSDLDNVIQDGWLRYDENGNYSLHPLVRTIVRFDFGEDEENKKNIAPKGTADKIINYFVNHENCFHLDKDFGLLKRMIDIARSVAESIMQEESERMAMLYHYIGFGYHELGEYSKALEFLNRAFGIRKVVFGMEHPSIANSYNTIGGVYHHIGDYDEALAYYKKALKIRESLYNNEHVAIAAVYNNIGGAYRGKGDYENALKYHFAALRIRENNLGMEHPDTANSYNNIGTVYREQNNFEEALNYYFKALAIVEKQLGNEHPITVHFYDNIGLVYQKQGDYKTALGYYAKAYQVLKKRLGKEHPNTEAVWSRIRYCQTAVSRKGLFCRLFDGLKK